MDFKQRLLTAMNHEEPDRVPVMGMIQDPPTIDAILERKSVELLEMFRKPEMRDAIKEHMSDARAWRESQREHWASALEAALRLGFDANWVIYHHMQVYPGREADRCLVLHDQYGRLWEMGAGPKGDLVYNYTGPLCETEEDWEAWVEEKAPLLDRVLEDAAWIHRRIADEYADRILPIPFAGPGLFENTWQPMGFPSFSKFLYEKPQFIRRVADFYSDYCLRHLEAAMESGVEIVMVGDDLGQKTGPMLRPELVEQLYGEGYRHLAEAAHRKNRKLLFHSCGNVYLFLDKFVEWGFDGLVTLEPTAGMDLGRVREQVGHRLVLVGNLDVSHLLVKGSRREIDETVARAMRNAARGGGYILSAAHSHASVDPVRLGWMLEAAHRHGEYPIRV